MCSRVILAPLQIGLAVLAVQMHQQFASKFLIDTLHSQGFCASYSEVKRFEVCAAKTQGTDIPGLQAGHFFQYIADNADHNINTLDGYNTFLGMGIIAAISPGIRNKLQIPSSFASNKEIAERGKIFIKLFKSPPLASLP
ncbi:hypothetical protein SNE40_002943 [Patella caerulea]|uniref:Uncharacterized protein n=1 Tax=Patella caerulea TaxID=87958 RepID=A0AAN8KCV6_PATCE